MKKTKVTAAILAIITLVSCSRNYYPVGEREFNRYNYAKALENFLKVEDPEKHPDLAEKIAVSYMKMNRPAEAEVAFSKVMSSGQSNSHNYYNFASVLMMNGKYRDAQQWLQKYQELKPQDEAARCMSNSCRIMDSLLTDSANVEISRITLPGVESAFAAVAFNKGLIFSADFTPAKEGEKYGWTGQSFLNLFYVQKDSKGNWGEPKPLKGEINGAFHDGVAAVVNKHQLYFTRNNIQKNKLVHSSTHENNLKIYKAKLSGSEWSELQEVPFNNNEYSVGHPALSSDGKTMYFISDKPGGKGGTDIYVTRLEQGTWTEPVNIGASVNTSGNEMFPTIKGDTLYFGSKGHSINFGGLDIYRSVYHNGLWTEAENLGRPYNSSKDDFSFIYDEKSRSGFLSSNRDGKDALYEFREVDPVFTFTGKVRRKGDGKAVQRATIKVTDAAGTHASIVVETDAEGNFSIPLKSASDFTIAASNEKYFSQTLNTSTRGLKHSKSIELNFDLEEIVMEKAIRLENIYYDLGKAELKEDSKKELTKLVELLVDNPGIVIELSSHTDSRSSDKYNLVLSERRARSAVEYIITSGIDPKRIIARGYGETKPVNRCANGVPCSEEEHAANRRTEFKVIKIGSAQKSLVQE